jgi:hypothetical protein
MADEESQQVQLLEWKYGTAVSRFYAGMKQKFELTTGRT